MLTKDDIERLRANHEQWKSETANGDFDENFEMREVNKAFIKLNTINRYDDLLTLAEAGLELREELGDFNTGRGELNQRLDVLRNQFDDKIKGG